MAVVASAIQSGEADQQTQAYHGAVHAYSKILALRGEYDSALCYLEQALTFFEADQDGAGQAAVLYDLGTVAWQREQAEAALEYYQTSLTIGAASHNRFHTAQCAGSIGSVYWRSYKNYGQALHWYQQALTSSRLLGYQWGIARWLGNIGLVYWKWGDYERSLTYQRQALEVYQAQGVEFQAALWQGNIGLLYAAMGDDEQALHYFEQALPIQHRLGAKFYRAEVLQAKAELLFRRQDYAAARRDNVEAMRLAANLDGTQVLFEAQLLAAKLAYATGQQTEAIRHLQSMLAGGEDFELAAIHYELWQLNGSRAHAEAALKLYQELAGHQQDVEYQKRLTRLTEVLQSDDHPKPDGSG
jgi:tetratricopeptide (TPR) repeat protein